MLPTSTEDVAAAVRYYYGLVPTAYGPRRAYGPFSEDGNVKIRVASRIRGIPMTNQYRQVLLSSPAELISYGVTLFWCVYVKSCIYFTYRLVILAVSCPRYTTSCRGVH